ncbi:MAG: hypothetical protein ACFFBD_08720, partial [Candidatus Hodarchaeota archaeon]
MKEEKGADTESKTEEIDEECERFVVDAEVLQDLSAMVAAQRFFDAGDCYDSKGNRKKAAQYLTLAGHFFAQSGDINKCADCYGKAAIRNILVDDLEAAKIIIERGEELGFDTFLFRTAKTRLESIMEEQAVIELPEEELIEPSLNISLVSDISAQDNLRLMEIGGQEDLHSRVELFQIEDLENLSSESIDYVGQIRKARDRLRPAALKIQTSENVIAPVETGEPFELRASLFTPDMEETDPYFVFTPIDSLLGAKTALETKDALSSSDSAKLKAIDSSLSSASSLLEGSEDLIEQISEFRPSKSATTLSGVTDLETSSLEDFSVERSEISNLKPPGTSQSDLETIGTDIPDPSSSGIPIVGEVSPGTPRPALIGAGVSGIEIPRPEIPSIDIEAAPFDIQEVLRGTIFEDEEFYADGTPTSVGLDYLSTSIFQNEKNVRVENAELVDIIPFEWQVIAVSAPGLELVSRKAVEDQGMLYRWRKAVF